MFLKIVLTCYNRINTTRVGLKSLFASLAKSDINNYTIVLVDDGSPDKTGEIIGKEFPEVQIVYGNGNLFWAKGMDLAIESGTQDYDYLLWFNDDVDLDINAFLSLEKAIKEKPEAVLVGATKATSGQLSYSGIKQSPWPKLTSFTKVFSENDYTFCDTFNGNFVAIPQKVIHSVGTIDSSFNHGFADFDYGLRCTKKNIPIYIIPKVIGFCDNNTTNNTHHDKTLSRIERTKKLFSKKGLSINDWFRFTKKHCGINMLYLFPFPYIKQLCKILLGK